MDRDGEKLSVQVRILSSQEADSRIPEIAALRIKIFREFPYIYEGSLEYEGNYLSRYLEAPTAKIVGAFNSKDELVGVATCLALTDELDIIKEPFIAAGFNVKNIFYFGESLLLKEFRGQGVGHKFFDFREKVAHENGAKWTTFCAVERSASHPMRPADYRPLDEFWKSREYVKHPELKSQFSWIDVGESVESSKTMIYWMKKA